MHNVCHVAYMCLAMYSITEMFHRKKVLSQLAVFQVCNTLQNLFGQGGKGRYILCIKSSRKIHG